MVCESFDRCCDDPTVRAMAPTQAACEQAVLSDCTTGTLSIQTAINDPRAGYDPTIAGSVFGTYRDYVDRCDPTIVVWSNRRDGLESALQGSVGNGEPCLHNQSVLDASNYPALLSCEDFSRACILRDTMNGVCEARRAMGDSCVLDFDCREELYCTGAIGGTCQLRLADGGVCGGTDGTQHHAWCRSSFCYRGHCEAPNRTHVYCGDYNPSP
jgi:hypothetical protein